MSTSKIIIFIFKHRHMDALNTNWNHGVHPNHESRETLFHRKKRLRMIYLFFFFEKTDIFVCFF